MVGSRVTPKGTKRMQCGRQAGRSRRCVYVRENGTGQRAGAGVCVCRPTEKERREDPVPDPVPPSFLPPSPA